MSDDERRAGTDMGTGARAGTELPGMRVPPPGPLSRELAARLERVESPAFGARRAARGALAGVEMAPIVYASGRGSNVVDVDGNRYVDLAAGFGALLLGHGDPDVARAMRSQADALCLALGDLYPGDAKVALIERLAALYPSAGARVMLGQSGSDAVSAALKTAKLATGRPGILAFEGAYHGLGYGPLAACGLKQSWRDAFADQLNPHVTFVRYPSRDEDLPEVLSDVERALAKGTVGAILVEPILGRGGCIVPPSGFLRELQRASARAGALLVADEIWTGLGRSGSMLASVEMGALPDLICLGKGLGGGLPISACIGSDEVMQAWRRDAGHEVVHTATFHGAPLACSTALATLDVIARSELGPRAARVGAALRVRIASALQGISAFQEVRGAGLMVGIALGSGASGIAVHRALLAAGYITTLGGRASEVLVLTPPLVIDERQLDGFVNALQVVLQRAPR